MNILFGEMTAQGHLSFFKFDLYFFIIYGIILHILRLDCRGLNTQTIDLTICLALHMLTEAINKNNFLK